MEIYIEIKSICDIDRQLGTQEKIQPGTAQHFRTRDQANTNIILYIIYRRDEKIDF